MNKHRTLKAAFAAVLAALMAFAVFPVSALPAFEAEKSPVAPFWTVPEGYNAHDYNKCAAFLEQEDENGVKNGEKINENYDPNDPLTWRRGENVGGYGFWFESGRLEYVEITGLDMVGVLDLSNCIRLCEVGCFNNRLTEINLEQTMRDCHIYSLGKGYIGYGLLDNCAYGVHAQVITGVGFNGFFSSSGMRLAPVSGTEYVIQLGLPIEYFDDYDYDYDDAYHLVSDVIVSFPDEGAIEGSEWWTPFGYNHHDYERCVAFFEQEDENGVKNGQKVNAEYDPSDPRTWNAVSGGNVTRPLFIWEGRLIGSNYDDDDENDGEGSELKRAYTEKMLKYAMLDNMYLIEKFVGTLDVSNCTALKIIDCQRHELEGLIVFGCTSLKNINCSRNQISELDVSSNAALTRIYCFNNELSALDVSNNPLLRHLNCNSNRLSELDVSCNPALEWLDCYDNMLIELDVSNNPGLNKLLCEDIRMQELDLSNNPELPYDLVKAEGPGSIGYAYGSRIKGFSMMAFQYDTVRYVLAYPVDGASFDGFYSEDGELISSGEWKEEYEAYCYMPANLTVSGAIVARFSDKNVVLGDIDGDGEVTALDALILMRYLVGEIDESSIDIETADVNGDGAIDLMDALIVLRMAIGEV